jgi:predicted MFS family arabinose efflux permease
MAGCCSPRPYSSSRRSGLTFASYAAGFATAALTWSRLPAAWHPRVPAACFASIAAAAALLAVATSGDRWPWPATVLLALAGAGHGAGFGALVQRTATGVTAEHAASFSGVLSTVNQLAIVAGIAVAGALYTAMGTSQHTLPPMSSVLVGMALVQAVGGMAVLRRGPASV